MKTITVKELLSTIFGTEIAEIFDEASQETFELTFLNAVGDEVDSDGDVDEITELHFASYDTDNKISVGIDDTVEIDRFGALIVPDPKYPQSPFEFYFYEQRQITL